MASQKKGLRAQMECVVLNSDIARLVLGYMNDQRLERAAHVFCKTSPHLQQEFNAYQQGLLAYSFFPALEEIICEHVKIARIVDQMERSASDEAFITMRSKKLSEKVQFLFDVFTKPKDAPSATVAGNSLHSDKENHAKKNRITKKRRLSTTSSNEEQIDGLNDADRKRRRILQPFCFLSDKQPSMPRCVKRIENCRIPDNDQSLSDDFDDDDASGEEDADYTDNNDDDIDMTNAGRPSLESTPYPMNKAIVTPTNISQAILDNNEFQMRLVENINTALQSTNVTDAIVKTKPTPAKTDVNVPVPMEEGKEEEGEGNDLLDRLVKSIINVTEKDPSFDALISNVIDASIKTTTTAGVQCNMEVAVPDNLQCNNEASTSGMPAMIAPNQPEQLLPPYSSAGTTTTDIETLQTNVVQMPPKTPLLIRTAIVSGSGGGIEACDALNVSTTQTNTSFGSLIDPNFSISKLIVVNSNDSAQKQPPEQHIGNVTADNILTQLSEGVSVDDLIYIDPTAGHITFPYIHYVTNDGFLTNLPFIINNELVAQQLQLDNFANLDASRIEIALPEPIMLTADQLPPNSVIVNSAQKAVTIEEQQQNQNLIQKTIAKSKDVTTLIGPGSLDSHVLKEGSTPINNNMHISRSLSTPRRRASHVRTLTFSPKPSSNEVAPNADAAPLATKRELRPRAPLVVEPAPIPAPIPAPPVSDKPIINKVEILTRGSQVTMDTSANDSSNSCSVPPLFVADESNQTVIKNDLKGKTEASASSNSTSDTPRIRKSRRAAVRSCKRQLSKSSNEEKSEVENEVAPVVEEAKSEPLNEDKEAVVEQPKASVPPVEPTDDKHMDEWVRLRHSSNKDLDARLREINSKMNSQPQKRVIKKNRRRKKSPEKKRKEIAAAEAAVEELDRSMLAVMELEVDQENNEISNAEEQNSVSIKTKIKIADNKETKQGSKDKKLEFNIVLPTPQKVAAKDKSSSTSAKDESKKQEKPVAEAKVDETQRTFNMATLFDTPFKVDKPENFVPPTPGIPTVALDTPLSKVRPNDDMTQFLFGSLTKSELNTPMLNAITPGFRFTPFEMMDGTPRSAPPTDYSSGGSYYKPDESDDLDGKIDRMLRDSAQKQRAEEEQPPPRVEVSKLALVPEPVAPCEETIQSVNKAVDIPMEIVAVEPMVLERVKDLNTETPIEPHYKLASGLPDEIENEDEETSSTIPSSTLSSSDSDLIADSSKSEDTNASWTEEQINFFGSVLSASSSDDTDWHKEEGSDVETAKLVNDDGEVRYPVRSWRTPRKSYVVPLIDANDARRIELDKKLLRVKEKLKAESEQEVKEIKPKVMSFKRLQMKKFGNSMIGKDTSSTTTENKKGIDVLTALQLSAKKQTSNEDVTPSEEKSTPTPSIPPPDLDDNAVSNIFSAPDVEKPSTSKAAAAATAAKSVEKNCNEARSATVQSRITTKSKNIVIKPLGFKGATKEDEKKPNETEKESLKNTEQSTEPDLSKTDTSPPLPKGKLTSTSKKISPIMARKSTRLEEAKASKLAATFVIKDERLNKSINSNMKIIKGKGKEKQLYQIEEESTDEQETPVEKEKMISPEEKLKTVEMPPLPPPIQKFPEPPPLPPPSPLPPPPQQEQSYDDSESEMSENSDDFSFVSFQEDNGKHFYHYKYDEKNSKSSKNSNNAPAEDAANLTDFQMRLTFSETESHVLTINDSIELFSVDPIPQAEQPATPSSSLKTEQQKLTNARTVPKKRKSRLSANTQNDDAAVGGKIPANKSKAKETAAQTNTKKEPKGTKQSAKNSKNKETVSLSQPNEQADLSSVDIETVLCHLHGK